MPLATLDIELWYFNPIPFALFPEKDLIQELKVQPWSCVRIHEHLAGISIIIGLSGKQRHYIGQRFDQLISLMILNHLLVFNPVELKPFSCEWPQ